MDLAGDLAGIKVSHDADDFDEGEEHILTLKDSRILDGEGPSASLQNTLSTSADQRTLQRTS